MEAHPYYQDGRVPRALWGVLGCAAISCILLIALPVVMILDRSGTSAAIAADQPGLDANGLDYAFYSVVGFALVLHAISVVLMVWFGLKVIKGRVWARIALTIALVVFTVGSYFSATAVPGYLWAVIPSDAAHLVMIILLWVPRPVRDYFVAHRAAVAVS